MVISVFSDVRCVGCVQLVPLNNSICGRSLLIVPTNEGLEYCCRDCLGVANGLLKILGLGKFSSDLEISESFVVSLGISVLHLCIFASRSRIFVLIVSGSDFH